MTDLVLALNVGSSSFRLAAYAWPLEPGARPSPRLSAHAADIHGRDCRVSWSGPLAPDSVSSALHGGFQDKLAAFLGRTAELTGACRVRAVGHRIVHGGSRFAKPVAVTRAIHAELARYVPLAPQHQPWNLAGIDGAAAKWPAALQIACFDTAFHRTQPDPAQHFALPREMTGKGYIRYGFHGLSYENIANSLPELLPAEARRRVIAAHLGHGASLCALLDGWSIATTMGFTALDGLPMAQRSGAVDPGLVLHLIEEEGRSAAEVRTLLYEKSGLLGLSGISGDMRVLLADPAPAAREAVAHFTYWTARHAGGLAAALGGLDALVFTGGVGENAAPVRADICQRLSWLGLDPDPAANEAGQATISTPLSQIAVLIVPADEESVIARAAADAVGETSTRERPVRQALSRFF